MDMERIRRYAEGMFRKRELERRLNMLKEELEPLEAAILEDFAADGLSSIRLRVDGHDQLVYLQKQLWAHAVDGDYPRAVRALRRAGLKDLVDQRFNVNTLSAWCRERDAAGQALPKTFTGAIEVAQVFQIRVKGGSNGN